MAQRAVEGVLQAFNQGMQLAQRKKEHEDAAQIASDAAQRQQDQFDKQQEAQNKMYELYKSQIDAAQAQQEYGNMLQFQKSGVAPTGSKVSFGIQPNAPDANQVLPGQVQLPPAAFTPGQAQPAGTAQTGGPTLGNVSPLISDPNLTRDIVQTPSGHIYNMPQLSQSPEYLYAQQAQREAEAREQKKIITTQGEETKRMLAVNEATQAWETKRFLAQIDAQGKNALAVRELENKARLQTEAMATQERIRTAMINATGGMSEMWGGKLGGGRGGGTSMLTGPGGVVDFKTLDLPASLNKDLSDLQNGYTTLDEIEKRNPKQKQMIATLAGTFNIGSLTGDDRKNLKDLQIMSQVAPILQQMHKLKRDSNTINVPGSDDFSAWNTLAGRLDTMVPKIATTLSGSKRMSEPELRRYLEGLAPSRVPIIHKAKTEIDKYNGFITDDLLNRAKDIVQGLPEGQAALTLKNYGFTGLPSLLTDKVPGTSQINRVIRDSSGKLVPAPGTQ